MVTLGSIMLVRASNSFVEALRGGFCDRTCPPSEAAAAGSAPLGIARTRAAIPALHKNIPYRVADIRRFLSLAQNPKCARVTLKRSFAFAKDQLAGIFADRSLGLAISRYANEERGRVITSGNME
jgi:hypothetical protein